MKKSILVIIQLLFVCVSAYAQWTTTGTVTSTTNNVGIGTATPDAPLDINGISLMAGGNANLDTVINPNRSLSFLENSGKLLIGWNRTGGAGEIDLISNQGGGDIGGIAFYNHLNNGTEKQLMWLTGDGALMIGSSRGNTGNNKLAVGGGVIAESVTVKLQSNWPDFVFKNNYQLPSLRDVKTYIAQYRHLPEIPSQADVAKDGINIGEMDNMLLKKVEELTLYLIEKDEEIKIQEAVNRENAVQINLLKKQLEVLAASLTKTKINFK